MVQPCNPIILEARDAILSVDTMYYHGAYRCEIMRGFAKRGLGMDATIHEGKAVNGFWVPPECETKQTSKRNQPTRKRK